MMRGASAPDPVRAYVAFGANLGEPTAAHGRAIEALGKLPGTRILKASSLYRTEPIGVSGQPDYINAVIEIETTMHPESLLDALLEIERTAGRTRSSYRAPRNLDLDLLLYGDTVLDTPSLKLPHPRMHRRAFVLVPMAEIAPDAHIPGRGPVHALLPAVADQAVTRIVSSAAL